MIRKDDFPFLPFFAILFYLKPDSILHATQVDRQMGCIGHQISIWVKESAREVESFFDVSACGSFLQSYAHLLSNWHESVTEDGQLYRIEGHLFYCLERLTIFNGERIFYVDGYVTVVIDYCMTVRLN